MPKVICSHQALLLPSPTRPAQRLQLTLPSVNRRRSYYRRLSAQGISSRLSPSPCALPASASATRATWRDGDDSLLPQSPGLISRTASRQHTSLCAKPQLSASLRAPRAPPCRSRNCLADRLTDAARSATAVLLVTSVVLSTALAGPPGRPALAAAGGVLAVAPADVAVSATGVSRAASVTAAPALAGGGAAAVAGVTSLGPDSPLAAPRSQPAAPAIIRFTGPDALDTLPPIPADFPPLPELKLPPYSTVRSRTAQCMVVAVGSRVGAAGFRGGECFH
jgi:hypothetical protein